MTLDEIEQHLTNLTLDLNVHRKYNHTRMSMSINEMEVYREVLVFCYKMLKEKLDNTQ